MLSKGKGTALLSAETRCPSSEATAPGDAGIGDEVGPSLQLSTPSVSRVHLLMGPHCAGDQRSCSCARARICLSWNLGNAADECSVQHLDCKSQCAFATVRALFAGYVEKYKAGAKSRLPTPWGKRCGYLATSPFQKAPPERQQEGAGLVGAFTRRKP